MTQKEWASKWLLELELKWVLLESLPKDGSYKVELYYSVKDQSEAVYLNVLEDIAKNNPNFMLNLYTSKEKGRLTAEAVAKEMPDLFERGIFICGPPPMMAALKNQFKAMKIKSTRIFSEEFSMT